MPAMSVIGLKRCLTPDELADFDSGNLSDDELEHIASHLSSCPSCESLLTNASSIRNDSLADKLRDCFALEASDDDAAISLLEARALDRTRLLPLGPNAVISEASPLLHTLIDTDLNGTRIQKLIGRGGMGMVFQGWQEALQRPVAVKFIQNRFPEADALARFTKEAKAIARLQHVHVARLYTLARYDGLPYFEMEFVGGGSLQDRLRAGPLSCRQAAQIVRAVAEAVAYAHDMQVVHRDLKPSNILLTLDEQPKIVDFGLAKLLDEQDGLTRSDMIMGTVDYMAPELVAGVKNPRADLADVYALGAILYECLTGAPPFKGSDRLATLRRVCDAPLTPPSQCRGGVPRHLEAICVKALEKSPSRRYQSAAELAGDLGRWLNHERPLGIPGSWSRLRRSLCRNWLICLLALVFITAAAVAYQRDPERPLREAQAELAAGKPVTLVDAQGRATWYRWHKGKKSSTLVIDDDDGFTVGANDEALIELLPDPKCDRYRIQAQVRHRVSTLNGRVGVYFGQRKFATDAPHSPIELRGELLFNGLNSRDSVPHVLTSRGPRPVSESRMQICCHLAPETREDWGELRIGMADGPEISPQATAVWRDLYLDISPEAIEISLTDTEVKIAMEDWCRKVVTQLERVRRMDQRKHLHTYVRPDFHPRGRIGLYVDHGSASFRSVIVTPQPNPDR